MKSIAIYVLICPLTYKVRYVGKTSQKRPTDRYSSHISVSKNNKKKDYTHCWIKSLLNKGVKPLFHIIEWTDDIKRETYWIKFYRNLHTDLTNFTDGGELGNLGKRWTVPKEKIRKHGKKVYMFNSKKEIVSTFEQANDFLKFYGLSQNSFIKKHTIMSDGLVPSYFPTYPKNITLKTYKEVIVENNYGNKKEFRNIVECSKFINASNITVSYHLRNFGFFKKNNYLIKFKHTIDEFLS